MFKFTGVVEDIKDPEEMGRVKVRCFGYHTENKNILKTADLPWAVVASPTSSANVSGLGTSPHGLVNGSWVIGFFYDEETMQYPVITHSLGSKYVEKGNSNIGFSDPDGTYPKDDYINESDINKLSRGENTIQYSTDNLIDEPASPFSAEYPYNKVLETESGHIVEYDDTPGAERIRIHHKSGTLLEFHPNGDIVSRQKNRWQVVTGNDKIHISGLLEVHIDGNANISVGGSTLLDCNDTTITGDLLIKGNTTVDGNIDCNSNISASSGDVTAGDISLSSHIHGGVDSGTSSTSGPK